MVLQLLFGKINFIRRFIPNFAEITKPISRMLKKDIDFRWNDEGKQDFKMIKEANVKAPVLVSPDYSKDFQFFLFAYEDIIVGLLYHKNDQGEEKPITFISKALRDFESKYAIMEKQAYVFVKPLKHFMVYVGYSMIVAYVPHSMVKDMLAQHDCLGVRGNGW
jgi:hypothetical protein